MTKEEKINFIKQLSEGLQEHLLLRMDKVPEEWTGFELRQWFADTALNEIPTFQCMSGSKLQKYKNDILIRNL